MRFLFRGLSGLFITALTFGLLFLAGFQVWQVTAGADDSQGSRAGRDEQVYTVRLQVLMPQRIKPLLQAYGVVESRRRLELRASAAGQIVALGPNMHEGGRVSAGELLVRVDPATAQAVLDSRIAARDDASTTLTDARRMVQVATEDLTSARRQAELRRAAVTRQNELAARGLGTSSDRETAELAASSAEQAVTAARSALASSEASVNAAQNALRRAEIDLTTARRDLTDTEIRASFNGRVTGITAVEGGLVSLNEQLGELIDPDRLEVSVPLSLQQFSRLVPDGGSPAGTPVTVVLDGSAGRLSAQAEIDRDAASVAAGSAGRVVYARIVDRSVAMRPGDFVTVEIGEPPLTDVAQIPASAVGADGAVLVAGDQGRLHAQPVRVLRRQGDDVIIALPDALNGARIVSERGPQLGAGIRVRDADAPQNRQNTPPKDQRAQSRGEAGNG